MFEKRYGLGLTTWRFSSAVTPSRSTAFVRYSWNCTCDSEDGEGAGSDEVDSEGDDGDLGGMYVCLTTATTFSEHRRCDRGGPRPHGAVTSWVVSSRL